MKITRQFLFFASLLGLSLSIQYKVDANQNQKKHTAPFQLSSPALKPMRIMPRRFAYDQMNCFGKNVSPPLAWKNAPQGTKSFAITMFDPDAPTGSGWWHWTLFNIPASLDHLDENASTDSLKLASSMIQGMNDYGKAGYGGACPPQADNPHRYIFTIYALKTEKLPLNQNAPGAQVGFHVRSLALDQASFTVRYGRKSAHPDYQAPL